MITRSREVLSRASPSALQIAVVGLTVVLNALNGFDVLAITCASPGIAAEWGVEPAALGVVLSMELVGMGTGGSDEHRDREGDGRSRHNH